MVEKLPFLSDDNHYAIASVATRAAQLDVHIEHAIASVLMERGIPKAAENILKNMNGDRYVNLLKDIFLDRLPSDKDEIEGLFANISRFRTARNEILHWLYGKADDADMAKSASVRPFRDRQERLRTAEQIQEVADGLLKSAAHITELDFRARGLKWPPETLPDKPALPSPPAS